MVDLKPCVDQAGFQLSEPPASVSRVLPCLVHLSILIPFVLHFSLPVGERKLCLALVKEEKHHPSHSGTELQHRLSGYACLGRVLRDTGPGVFVFQTPIYPAYWRKLWFQHQTKQWPAFLFFKKIVD